MNFRCINFRLSGRSFALMVGLLGVLSLSPIADSMAGRIIANAPVPPVTTDLNSQAPQSPQVQLANPHLAGAALPLAAVTLKADASVRQGETFSVTLDMPEKVDVPQRVEAPQKNAEALYAIYLDKKIPLFQTAVGHYVGWMPVSVFQKVGQFTLGIRDKQNRLLASQPVTVADAKFNIQNIKVSKSMGGLQPEPGELDTVANLKQIVSWQKFWDGEFISPTTDCQNSPFGNLRYHNGKPTGDYHKGVDLRSPLGRPIKAINGGKVVIARKFRLHGGTVGLDHGYGFTSIYIHMSQINVKPGQVVKKGDVIGKVGATGFATGPHLHWGLFVNGLPVNPSQWVHNVPRCG
ncbi:MAG: M23 family metallopeptidase [Vampirovibrionales bacterium]|nr:M23 family metallopeptidase [Vampirovibrionales bacterium]